MDIDKDEQSANSTNNSIPLQFTSKLPRQIFPRKMVAGYRFERSKRRKGNRRSRTTKKANNSPETTARLCSQRPLMASYSPSTTRAFQRRRLYFRSRRERTLGRQNHSLRSASHQLLANRTDREQRRRTSLEQVWNRMGTDGEHASRLYRFCFHFLFFPKVKVYLSLVPLSFMLSPGNSKGPPAKKRNSWNTPRTRSSRVPFLFHSCSILEAGAACCVPSSSS